jgi:homoserine kinase type II
MGPIVDEQADRARFSRHELAAVLEHYDIGDVQQIDVCALGSGKAPKVRVRADRGDFFLKRRAPGRDDIERVAFAHAVQRQLSRLGYPVPRILDVRGASGDGPSSVLRLDDGIYELFEYVDGLRPDRSVVTAARAGSALGRLHRLLAGWQPPLPPPRGGYHGSDQVGHALRLARRAIRKVEPTIDAEALREQTRALNRAYRDAAARVDEAGYATWESRLLHGDWHPGNLLYRGGDVIAVLDFDSARLEPRMSDVANGALQFSIQMGGSENPLEWPEGLDPAKIRVFLREYDLASGEPLRPEERASLPWLIIEALVVESVVPIAATGRFSRLSGSRFLAMVRAKIEWLRPRAEDLLRDADDEDEE